jgi:hypothetical protein
MIPAASCVHAVRLGNKAKETRSGRPVVLAGFHNVCERGF